MVIQVVLVVEVEDLILVAVNLQDLVFLVKEILVEQVEVVVEIVLAAAVEEAALPELTPLIKLVELVEIIQVVLELMDQIIEVVVEVVIQMDQIPLQMVMVEMVALV